MANQGNQNQPTADQLLAEAIASEQAIADEAKEIWGDSVEITPALFMQLWPLLKRPIPSAFIETVGKVEGKPYPSTGVRSVQVQIDRMNNVLTPLFWWDDVNYTDGGKLAKVTIFVGTPVGREGNGDLLLSRSSYGGVARGSGQGNIYKGSYTNAAKLAFARLGPGHEVYLGAADFDPDTDSEAADAQGKAEAQAQPDLNPAGEKIAGEVVNRAWDLEVQQYLRLAASRQAGTDVGDCDTKAKAKKALAKLTIDQLEILNDRLVQKSEKEKATKEKAAQAATGEEAPNA